MKKRRSAIPKSIKIIVFLTTLFLLGFMYQENMKLKEQLEKVKIFDYQDNTMLIRNGSTITDTTYMWTNDYLKQAHQVYSPFGDEKTLRELMKKYIRVRRQDTFGARRSTGEFRRWHEGIDLFVPRQTKLYPMGKIGIVTQVSDNPHFMMDVDCTHKKTKEPGKVKVEYGKIVRIVYPEGFESIYAHMDSVFVEAGQIVDNTTLVGLTGVTGNLLRSGKPSHLHFELRDENGKSFDPEDRLNYKFPDMENYLKWLKY
jgi:murein DD-endopeptidase MepM/ murein hydrolase activator NlpD